MTKPRYNVRLSSEVVVERLNRTIVGWANYFSLGNVSPAYSAVNQHAVRRLRQWLCRKQQDASTGNSCTSRPTKRILYVDYGLTLGTRKTRGLSSAKA